MRGDAHYLESPMADFQPVNRDEQTIVLKKTEAATLVLALSVAALTLSRVTKLDPKYWIQQAINEAKQRCSTFSTEEVDELLSQFDKLREQ